MRDGQVIEPEWLGVERLGEQRQSESGPGDRLGKAASGSTALATTCAGNGSGQSGDKKEG